MTAPIELAAILCGGQGSRLRSVIGEHQKCAAPVAGAPLLHRLLGQVADAGLKRIIFLTGYRSDEMMQAFQSWPDRRRIAWAVSAHCEDGPEAAVRLGHMWAKRFLLLNGDTLVPGFSLGAFLAGPAVRRSHSVTVLSPSALTGARAEAGVWVRCNCREHKTSLKVLSTCPHYDMGTPAGLELLERALA